MYINLVIYYLVFTIYDLREQNVGQCSCFHFKYFHVTHGRFCNLVIILSTRAQLLHKSIIYIILS